MEYTAEPCDYFFNRVSLACLLANFRFICSMPRVWTGGRALRLSLFHVVS